jgi:hypothetical protein
MPRRLLAGIVGVAVLAGCGGSSETSTTKTAVTVSASRLADLEIDALGGTADINGYCHEWIGGTNPDRARVSRSVSRLTDAYRASRWTPAIREHVRDAATTLRDCGEEGQADRLDRLADAH